MDSRYVQSQEGHPFVRTAHRPHLATSSAVFGDQLPHPVNQKPIIKQVLAHCPAYATMQYWSVSQVEVFRNAVNEPPTLHYNMKRSSQVKRVSSHESEGIPTPLSAIPRSEATRQSPSRHAARASQARPELLPAALSLIPVVLLSYADLALAQIARVSGAIAKEQQSHGKEDSPKNQSHRESSLASTSSPLSLANLSLRALAAATSPTRYGSSSGLI